jgi:hypothetical protein
MSNCIDVFYTPENRTYTYITFVIDENGAVITSRSHQHIATVADWCKRQALPARSSSALVREELAAYGVEVRPPAPRATSPFEEQPDTVTLILPREQANLLRQLLTTMREWGEGGRSTIRYIFAAYAEWLSDFDQELARALRSDGNRGSSIGQMKDRYIDVFYSPNDYHTPYQVWVWNTGRVVERASHVDIEQTVSFCEQKALPVLSNDPELRAELRAHGINVRHTVERELGDAEQRL